MHAAVAPGQPSFEVRFETPPGHQAQVDWGHLGQVCLGEQTRPHGDLDLWQFDGWQENDGGGIYFYNDHRAETPWGHTRPDYGRLHLVGWSDLVRNQAGVPTLVGGGLTTADQVNTVLAAGRADLCLLDPRVYRGT